MRKSYINIQNWKINIMSFSKKKDYRFLLQRIRLKPTIRKKLFMGDLIFEYMNKYLV